MYINMSYKIQCLEAWRMPLCLQFLHIYVCNICVMMTYKHQTTKIVQLFIFWWSIWCEKHHFTRLERRGEVKWCGKKSQVLFLWFLYIYFSCYFLVLHGWRDMTFYHNWMDIVRIYTYTWSLWPTTLQKMYINSKLIASKPK